MVRIIDAGPHHRPTLPSFTMAAPVVAMVGANDLVGTLNMPLLQDARQVSRRDRTPREMHLGDEVTLEKLSHESTRQNGFGSQVRGRCSFYCRGDRISGEISAS